MHETMLYTPAGLPLGLIDAQVWVRDPADFGKKHRRKELPIAAKESNKWLKGFEVILGAGSHPGIKAFGYMLKEYGDKLGRQLDGALVFTACHPD
jgi:hypothetical protein